MIINCIICQFVRFVFNLSNEHFPLFILFPLSDANWIAAFHGILNCLDFSLLYFAASMVGLAVLVCHQLEQKNVNHFRNVEGYFENVLNGSVSETCAKNATPGQSITNRISMA